jgi:uncharacterized protein (DUF1697 family)
MSSSVVLIRGINVGGKNPVKMADLRVLFDDLGCTNVETLLVSGNAVVDDAPRDLAKQLEAELPKRFALHDEAVKVLVLTAAQFRAIIADRPKGFGDHPELHHSDVLFLIGIPVDMSIFDPREGVDAVWAGTGVVYSQRLSAERTKSRLSKMMFSPDYKSMTIRSWSTTMKLAGMLDRREAGT